MPLALFTLPGWHFLSCEPTFAHGRPTENPKKTAPPRSNFILPVDLDEQSPIPPDCR
jgi:hypothetical protein